MIRVICNAYLKKVFKLCYFYLIVPPTWKYKPTDVEAKNGDTIFLDCTGDGKPKPTFKWIKLPGKNKIISFKCKILRMKVFLYKCSQQFIKKQDIYVSFF